MARLANWVADAQAALGGACLGSVRKRSAVRESGSVVWIDARAGSARPRSACMRRTRLNQIGISVVLIEPTWVATDIAHGSLQQTIYFPVATREYEGLSAKTGAYISDRLTTTQSLPLTWLGRSRQLPRPRPKARYVLPAKARVLVSLMVALPDRFADRASAARSVPRVEMWPAPGVETRVCQIRPRAASPLSFSVQLVCTPSEVEQVSVPLPLTPR